VQRKQIGSSLGGIKIDKPNVNFSKEYFERNLAVIKLIPNSATFWFQGVICICGQKDKHWEYLIPEAKLGLSNALFN